MAGITNALNSFTQSTVNAFDPTTSAMSTLQQTLTGLGGGLGSVILSIPGIGQPTVTALNSLKKKAEDTLANARSMTPDKIREENDKINREYQELVDKAKKKGETPPPRPTTIQKTRTSITTFFKDIFSNTLYICLFIAALVFGLFGSSVAANSIGPGMPFYYYIYYMLYGFILFPAAILLGIYKYYIKGKRPMFYAVWAPIYKGNYMGLFQYNLVNTDIVHYVSQSTAVAKPTDIYETSAVSQRTLISPSTISKPKAVFEPTSVQV
jgi:hypothetical protein